jgi:hypothetical protein
MGAMCLIGTAVMDQNVNGWIFVLHCTDLKITVSSNTSRQLAAREYGENKI